MKVVPLEGFERASGLASPVDGGNRPDGPASVEKAGRRFDKALDQEAEHRKDAARTAAPPRVDSLPGTARLSSGVILQELTDLHAALQSIETPSRAERVARWAIAAEIKRFGALDEYMTGFLRG
ncbi:hypothetical protein [Roseobacter weihaiensis]|uniref:hypothetical protein n=1 Tax=Roseobacter weihaiensis TaxID=2763262 RepID=UPI001D0B4E4D|nr:hypothetical protein [Roseobacter sp. H9]